MLRFKKNKINLSNQSYIISTKSIVLKVKTIFIRSGLILLLGIMLFSSCSTKKNSFTRRFYHNMTARYNGYFNGNESYKTGVVELEKLHVDDYSKILSIYKLGTAENATSMNSYFDKAFTKASTVITRHSIFIKKKEHVRWIPEAYLLIGKSYFYKQEYKLASEVFEYIIKTYTEYPSKYNAMLWLARTYIQQKKFEKAQSMLDLVQNKIDKNKKEIPKQVLKSFPVVYADYYLKQESNEQAIEYLMAGIDKNKKKAVRMRLRFILAQIYQESGKIAMASALYDKVIKMNPPYEMAFNAKINKAMCYDASTGDSKAIKALLYKMARDSKNKDYLDQIYYALAEICMKESDTTCAIDNYKLSATKSVSNNKQKAVSYLKLAKLYFAIPEYEQAEMYYDSTMTVLPKDFPNYDKIAALSDILKNLVTNLKVVELQDSLQDLSKMTPAERNKIIDNIIMEVIKAEQKKQEEEYQKQLDIYNANTTAATTTTNTTAAWYFYNPTAVNFGKTEFIKKWGSRKLEDLWRLTNKSAIADFGIADNTNDTASTDSIKTTGVVNLKDKNYYLKNIPVTAEDIQKSNDLIAEALYNIGLIYENDLADLLKAIKTYEEFIERFPNNKDYIIKVYYQLYLIYSNLNDESKTNFYKNLICSKEPDSDYCNIIKNPNYKKITTENEDIAVSLYKETYNAYKAGNWDSVLARSNRASTLFGGDTSLIPKFLFLKALAYGKNKDSVNIIKTLNSIIDLYPASPVKPMAQDLLDFWTGQAKAFSSSSANNTSSSLKGYLFDENAIHLYSMIVTVSKNIKISELKNLLSDFNTKNFSTANLTINNLFLDNTRQIITISNFPDKAKAMLYFNLLKNDKDVFAKLTPADYKQFVISVDNYSPMFKNKDIDNYYIFFQENYLKE
jgi:tetratricopeptide (TPR) repeat protein